MARDVIKRRPWVSVAMLAAGTVGTWFLCQRAMRRRGYPEIDPFWLAMPHLWVFPLLLSALFDARTTTRKLSLAAYAVISAIIGAGTSGGVVPRHIDALAMVMDGMFVYAPFYLLFGLGIEWLWQRGIGLFRAFEEPTPSSAGDVRGGSTPLGAMESAARVRPSLQGPRLAPPDSAYAAFRVSILFVIVSASAIMFPGSFRVTTLVDARNRGKRQAERDWATNDPILYVPMETYATNMRKMWGYQPGTGLFVRMKNPGVSKSEWADFYNAAIQEKLSRHGPAPMAKFLLTEAEVRKLMAAGRFERVTSFPLRHGPTTIRRNGDVKAPNMGYGSGLGWEFVYKALVPEKGGALLVLTDSGALVLHPDGRLLQVGGFPVLERDIVPKGRE